MDHICLAIPVLPGKTDDARRFMQQLDGSRRTEFDASERRIGISKELWYLARLASGDVLIGYLESRNFGSALNAFVGSRDAFDLWFKEQMRGVTGFDLNNPPADMQPCELLSHYELTAVGA
jgi:hypothetical protein